MKCLLKNKIIIISGILISICFISVMIFLFPKVREETDNRMGKDNFAIEELFEKKGHFYVYFYNGNCPYCENVQKDIEDFAGKEKVYFINTEMLDGIQEYNWERHGEEYDVEIGERQQDGQIKFYNGYNEIEIKGKYPPLKYKIILANDGYAEMNSSKEVGKIYAISTHPFLKQEDLQKEGFTVPAVPMLMEFDDNQVINYFFDDKEILNYLESDTQPLDKYWNIK